MIPDSKPLPGKAWALAACAVFGLLLAAYWFLYRVAFDAPFYFDTVAHLITKTNLHMVDLTPRSLDAAVRLDFGGKLYRPLSYLSLALTHYFWGLAPRAYRIGNLLIHWSAGLALFFFLGAVLRTPRVREENPWAAARWLPVSLLAVLLWGLHPVQTNVVTYEIQRMASLCGLFVFLSVGAYLRARAAPLQWSWGWGLLSLAGLAAATASKENGLVAVPLALLAEVTLLVPPTRAGARRALLGLALCLGVLVAAGLAWKLPTLWPYLQDLAQRRSFTTLQRLLTQATLQPRYALLLLVPDARFLTLDADVAVVRSLLEPLAAGSVAAIALAVGLAVRTRRRHPLFAFGVLWFFAAQLLESTLVPLELYFEHRLYIPSAFVYLGLALAAARGWAGGSWRRAGAVLACGVFLSAAAWGTHERNVLWSDPVQFWADAVRKAPDKPRPYINLAETLVRHGYPREAEQSLLCALSLGGDRGPIYLNLAMVARDLGRPDVARRRLMTALEADPDSRLTAERGLAQLCIKEGKLDEAVHHLEEVLRRRPVDVKSLNLLGTVALIRGQLGDAEAVLTRAVGYDPVSDKAWNNLGVVYFRRGDYGRAARCFEKALRLMPSNGEYRSNLAKAQRPRPASPAGAPAKARGSDRS